MRRAVLPSTSVPSSRIAETRINTGFKGGNLGTNTFVPRINFCSKPPLKQWGKGEGECRGGDFPLCRAKFDFAISSAIQYMQIQKTNKKAPAWRQVQKGCSHDLHYLIHL